LGIISVSLNNNVLDEMNKIQKEMGFSGRSELIRAGIRMLSNDKLEKSKLTGNIGCVLSVTHDEKDENNVTELKHQFFDVIKTHVHYKLGTKKCLELFVLDGSADRIRNVTQKFQRDKKMESINLTICDLRK